MIVDANASLTSSQGIELGGGRSAKVVRVLPPVITRVEEERKLQLIDAPEASSLKRFRSFFRQV
jgi:hypothetical protein